MKKQSFRLVLNGESAIYGGVTNNDTCDADVVEIENEDIVVN